MSELVQAKVSHQFKSATAFDVYDAWLNEADVREWMADALSTLGLAGELKRIEIDARIGGAFFFSDMRDGEEARHWGTYRALERPHLIEFTWITSEKDERNDTSVVHIEITPKSAGCAVELIHSLSAEYAAYIPQTETGWSTMLQAIEKRCGAK